MQLWQASTSHAYTHIRWRGNRSLPTTFCSNNTICKCDGRCNVQNVANKGTWATPCSISTSTNPYSRWARHFQQDLHQLSQAQANESQTLAGDAKRLNLVTSTYAPTTVINIYPYSHIQCVPVHPPTVLSSIPCNVSYVVWFLENIRYVAKWYGYNADKGTVEPPKHILPTPLLTTGKARDPNRRIHKREI